MKQFIEIRKKRMLKFILKYFSKNDYMPTLNEIAQREKISIERVRVILNELVKDKKIQRKKNKIRSIKVFK